MRTWVLLACGDAIMMVVGTGLVLVSSGVDCSGARPMMMFPVCVAVVQGWDVELTGPSTLRVYLMIAHGDVVGTQELPTQGPVCTASTVYG